MRTTKAINIQVSPWTRAIFCDISDTLDMTMRGVFEEMVKSYPGYLRDSSIAKAEVLEKSGHEKLKQASAGPWDMDNYCAMDELYDSGEKDIREAMVFRKIAEMADKVYNRMIWGAK